MYALNIQFESLQLNKEIISKSDKVCVTVMAFPEHNKSSFVVAAKDMCNLDHTFTINITNQTKAILFLFEKKAFFSNDPIIASNVIEKKDLLKIGDDKQNTEIKTYNILEPIQNISENSPNTNRRIFGKMIFKVYLTDPIIVKSNKINKYNIKKLHKGNGYSQVDDENLYQNNLLDDEFY